MEEKLTMEQAIEIGFTHFVEYEGDRIISFSSIGDDNRKYYKEKKYFLVDKKNPICYTIDESTIKELISEHVANQDEMADEEERLYAIAEDHDYSRLANELNEKFKTVHFYSPTEIEVFF